MEIISREMNLMLIFAQDKAVHNGDRHYQSFCAAFSKGLEHLYHPIDHSSAIELGKFLEIVGLKQLLSAG